MSDMMPQRPPMGGTPQGGMDVRNKMSMLNPTDMAAKLSRGDISKQQTVGEFLQRNFGVQPQDPVEKLFAAVREQGQNATVAGKMGMGQQSAQRPMPQQRPQGPQQPMRSMDDLTSRI